MNITTIDKVACNVIREKFEAKMSELKQETGISFDMGSMSYNPDGESASFKVKIEVGDAIPQTVKDYNRYVGILELPILGTKIKLNGKVFKTSGFRTKARKKPILITDVITGKEYIASEDAVKRNIIN
jgi:hypothetical protein